MKVIQGTYGVCYITDCLPALRQLPTQSIGLFLSDPPYNAGYKGEKQSDSNLTEARNECYKDKIFFNDNIPNYPEWCKEWWTEVKRVTENQIFTPGLSIKNLHMWFDIEEPLGYIAWEKPNCAGVTDLFRFIRQEPILVYGKSMHQFVFLSNHIRVSFERGFMQDKKEQKNTKHGCPKPVKLYEKIITRLKPKSVLDAFMGSGVTAEVCERLGIKWIGYEINPDFISDIKFRIKRGQQTHKLPMKQQELFTRRA
jgi:DNA modification methylase